MDDAKIIKTQYYSNEPVAPQVDGQVFSQQNAVPQPAQQSQPIQTQTSVPATPAGLKEQITANLEFGLNTLAILFLLWGAITWKKKWQQSDFVSALVPILIALGLFYCASFLR